ncbi:MAG: hypothetical protein AVDCRST_MAG05-354, partial [uncultured Rubrobacteraceae bacterium]
GAAGARGPKVTPRSKLPRTPAVGFSPAGQRRGVGPGV